MTHPAEAGTRKDSRTEYLMNKSLLSRALVAAAVVAAAGIAQAETFNVPQQAGEASTMTMGAPNQLTTNTPAPSYVWSAPVTGTVVVPSYTTVMGGAPVITTYDYPSTVSVNPTWNAWTYDFHGSASNTTSVPDRAGEASNFVNGVPNAMP
jgi:hypothetical protein